MKDDSISRQAVLDKFEPWLKVKDYNDGELNMLKAILYEIRFMPSAQSESFEWCTDCKEYDQEQHCCHRFTKVIRQAFEEMKVVHCIDCQHSEYDEVYKDRYCHYNGKAEVVDDYHFCRDGEKRDDDVTCENCEYSEQYVDGLILCRRTKTSHRVSATSTCGKGKREVEDAEAKI